MFASCNSPQGRITMLQFRSPSSITPPATTSRRLGILANYPGIQIMSGLTRDKCLRSFREWTSDPQFEVALWSTRLAKTHNIKQHLVIIHRDLESSFWRENLPTSKAPKFGKVKRSRAARSIANARVVVISCSDHARWEIDQAFLVVPTWKESEFFEVSNEIHLNIKYIGKHPCMSPFLDKSHRHIRAKCLIPYMRWKRKNPQLVFWQWAWRIIDLRL